MTPQTPPPTHTDQCIQDAARYGFCEHTLLPRIRTRSQPPPPPPPTLRRQLVHELLGWLGVGALGVTTVYLVNRLGWPGLGAVLGLGVGYLIVGVVGPPKGLTFDPTRILPPDARERLNRPS